MAKRPRAPQLVNPPFGRAAVRDSTTNALTYYPSPSLAAANCPAGGTIELFGDYGAFNLDKSITVLAWFSRCIDLDGGGGVAVGYNANAPISVKWYGGAIDGRLALCKHLACHTGYFYGLQMLAPTAYVQMLGLLGATTGYDLWTLDNCRLNRIVLAQRADGDQKQRVYLAGGTHIGSPATTDDLVNGLAAPTTIITNQDAIYLAPAGKQAFNVSSSNGGPGAVLLQGSAHSNVALPSYQTCGTTDGWQVSSSVDPRTYIGGDSWYPAGAPATAPGAMGTVTALAGDGQAQLTFSPIAGATTYTAKSRPSGSGPYVTGATGSGSPLVITGLPNGAARDFIVVPSNGVGDGTASAPVTATPVASVTAHDFVPADMHNNADRFTRGDGQEIYSSLAGPVCYITGGVFNATIVNSLPGGLGTQASVAVWADGAENGYLTATGNVTLPSSAPTKVELVFSFTSRSNDAGEVSQTTCTRITVPSGGNITMVAPAYQSHVIISTTDSTFVGVGASVPGHKAAIVLARRAMPLVDIICVRAIGGKTVNQLVNETGSFASFQTSVNTIFNRSVVTRKNFVGQLLYNDAGAGRTTAQVAADWGTVVDWMSTAHPSVNIWLGNGFATVSPALDVTTFGAAVAGLATGREENLSIWDAHSVVSTGNLAADGVHVLDAGQVQQKNAFLKLDLFRQLLALYTPDTVVVNGSNVLTQWNDAYGTANLAPSDLGLAPVRTAGKLIFTADVIDPVLVPGLATAGNGAGISFIATGYVDASTSGVKLMLTFGTDDSNQFVAFGHVNEYVGWTTFTSSISGISDANTVLTSEVVISGTFVPQDPNAAPSSANAPRLYVNNVYKPEASTRHDFSGGSTHTVRTLSGLFGIGLGSNPFSGGLQKIQLMPRLSRAALRAETALF